MMEINKICELLKCTPDMIHTETSLRSLNYAPHWTNWEMIREIVQNSLDATEKVTELEETSNSVILKDSSEEGMSIKEFLLMGYTQKDGISTRGRHGEGLKVSFAHQIKQGRIVVARSQKWVCVLDVGDFEGEERMIYHYAQCHEFYHGVKYEIFGLQKDVKEIKKYLAERFYAYDNPHIKVAVNVSAQFNSVMLDKTFAGKMFVKNIYVKDIDSIFGYDCASINNLGRDRNTVNEKERDRGIGHIISQITDVDLAKEMLSIFVKGKKVESKIDQFYPTHGSMWKNAFEEMYGYNAVISEDDELRGQVTYRQKRLVVINNSDILYGLRSYAQIKDARTFIAEYNEALRRGQKKSWGDMSKKTQSKLMRAFKIIKLSGMFSTTEEEFIKVIKTYKKADNEKAHHDGKDDTINMTTELMQSDISNIAQSMGHEFIHKESNADDCSAYMQQKLDQFVREFIRVHQELVNDNVIKAEMRGKFISNIFGANKKYRDKLERERYYKVIVKEM